jgi:formylglycine-generating enzyme required for sulfatase activity
MGAVIGNKPSCFKDNPNRPVEHVSWDDVQAFLRMLNERERGEDYRLPTEAQWEYACRAGTETPWYYHDVNAIAWYEENSNGRPQPVGQKLPNAWGLFDMLGGMWEWCHDGLREYTTDAVLDSMGPTSAGTLADHPGRLLGRSRVVRAGGLPFRKPPGPPRLELWLPLCEFRRT